MHLTDDLLPFATDLARQAGALLLERFGGPASGVQSKSTRTDLVSDADRDAEALILGAIRTARPDDAIVAEESGASGGHSADAVRWHIDPLDGTINYLWGIPHWAVSIHAADGTGDLVGVVYDACRDEMFTAIRGRTELNGERLTLAPSDDLANAMLGTGFAYSASTRQRQAQTVATLLHHVRDLRRAGSAALDLAWVAAGRLDVYYERDLAIWDRAAGSMIVREAGGETLPLPATDDLPDGLIAARPGLADQLHPFVVEDDTLHSDARDEITVPPDARPSL